ncbi:protein FAM169B [Clinocottus analis]|uniref:protein FAM169B n=1 Tax=Clinocottus analis TaxID=304258 RepID=UPI0035C18658
MYPVDLPALEDAELTSSSEEYLSSLEAGPRDDEWVQLSLTSKVAVALAHVSRMQLFEDDRPDCTLLALHPPEDPARVAAVFLHRKWWRVEDVLRTASSSRVGLISVRSLVERVIVFLLSRVVERSSQEELLFSLHPRTESCKLLWSDGQAVGFYTVKHRGSLCGGGGGGGYQLPALDTVLVRRSWRRRGLGLQMLSDFCCSFSTEPFLGISSPLSPGMVAVCSSFLQQHQQHLEHLYEVEAPGDWTQRRNIWLSIQLGRYSLGAGDEEETQRNQDQACLKTPTGAGDPADPAPSSSAQQVKACDPIRGGSSPSSEVFAAHADDPDPGPPARPPAPTTAEHGVKPDPPLCEEAEEAPSAAKRGRRT